MHFELQRAAKEVTLSLVPTSVVLFLSSFFGCLEGAGGLSGRAKAQKAQTRPKSPKKSKKRTKSAKNAKKFKMS